MSEHTPGPWRVHGVGADAWTRQIWTDEGHGSVMVATTGGKDKSANAQLVKASPDLLNAAEQALSVLEWIRDGAEEGVNLDSPILLLRFAIESATEELTT